MRMESGVRQHDVTWSYIRSKQLDSWEDVNVNITQSVDIVDDATITKVSAKREDNVANCDITAMDYYFRKDETTRIVSLTYLAIHVEPRFPGWSVRDICQLPNGEIVSVAYSSEMKELRLMKLDCFHYILDEYQLVQYIDEQYTWSSSVCTIDNTTIAVTQNNTESHNKIEISVFSVMNNLKLKTTFNVDLIDDIFRKLTFANGVLQMVCAKAIYTCSPTGGRLNRIRLPFIVQLKSCTTSDGLIHSFDPLGKLTTTDLKGNNLGCIPIMTDGECKWLQRSMYCDRLGNVFCLMSKGHTNAEEWNSVKVVTQSNNGMTKMKVKSNAMITYPSYPSFHDVIYHEELSDMLVFMKNDVRTHIYVSGL